MTSVARQIVNFSRLIQAAKLAPIEIAENLRDARVRLPGIGDRDVRKIVLEDLPDVVTLFTLTRQRAWQAGFLEMARLRQSGHTFITGQRYKVLPILTPPQAASGPTEAPEPWHIDMGLSYVGETSFYTTAALCLHSDVLVNTETAWAYVDKGSRRKARLPNWFREKCSTEIGKVERPERIVMPKVEWPADTPLETRIISDDDIDHFGHSNHSNYVSYSVESLGELLSRGRLSTTSDNKCCNVTYSWPLLQAEIIFSGESRTGDHLDITTLPTLFGANGGRFLCQIRKNGSETPIAQVHFTISSAVRLKSCM